MSSPTSPSDIDSKHEINQVERVPSSESKETDTTAPGVQPLKSYALPKNLGTIDEETARYASTVPVHVDEATDARLKRMLDRRILPIMVATYLTQALDKGTISFASIMGIIEDTKLVGQQFALLTTIVWVGILLGEYPVARIIQRFPIGKYLGFSIMVWGVIVCCHAACRNFAQLMVVRLILGLCESCAQPCNIAITAMWYKREEHPKIISFWYSMMGANLIVGGLIAAGVSYITTGPLKSWQALYIIIGVASIFWGAFVVYALPDSPMRAKCYSEEDKRLIVERVRSNELGIQNKQFKLYQLKEAATDPIVWCYVLMQLSTTMIVQGLSTYSNLLIKSFGFSVLNTQLLNVAQGTITIAIMLGAAWLCTWWKQTILVMLLWEIPAIIGTFVLLFVEVKPDTRVGLLIAFYMLQFYLAKGNVIASLVSRNIAGQTKKTIATATTFVAWATGNMIGPQIFQYTDAPRYRNAFTVHLCIYCFTTALFLFTRSLLIRRNMEKRKLAGGDSASEIDQNIKHENAFNDLTDRENPDFRYDY